uniref:CYP5217A8 n=1 Tax=Danielia oregonensis TaxID=46584 RepID=A0A1B3B2L2_9ASCO|nr:CYP5217A8 [[Candida] oregonensis]
MLGELVVALWLLASENQYTTLVVAATVLAAYKLVIYPFFLSPLKNIPGPYLYRISAIPALENQRKHQWIKTVHALHAKYGEVVVLLPTAISCSGDSKYIQDIYVKNMPKLKFYEHFRNHGFRDNMFASLENDRHIRYKRMVQNLYLKSAVFSPKNSTRENIVAKVEQLVNQPKDKSLAIDVYSLFGSLAMDVVSAFELGVKNGTDLLLHPTKRLILVPHRLQAGMVFWTTLMPRFWDWAAGDNVKAASKEIEEWQLNLYGNAEKNVPKFEEDENWTTLETFKKNGLLGKNAYSFLSDNIFAGHETTAIQLTYLTYELSRPVNRYRQAILRKELVEAFGKPGSTPISDLDRLDKLPYLEALLQENSRVHSSIPGGEPRVVPKEYKVQIGKKSVAVPVGTTISCQPYLMHRVESVFPNPDAWLPERWLQKEDETDVAYKARMTAMQRYMMPFGKGVRMCLGMNVALIEMKAALANLYWRFESDISADWCQITKYDSNTKAGNNIGLGSHYMVSDSDESMMTMMDSYTTRPYYDECWLEWLEAE